jgi:TPR repeat protein
VPALFVNSFGSLRMQPPTGGGQTDGDIAFSKAEAYFNQNKIADALDWMQRAVKLKNVHAMYRLCIEHYSGGDLVLIINYNAALEYCEEAGNSGSQPAMYMAGLIFFKQQNYSKAYDWYLRGFNEKYADAISGLASLYLNGYFVSKNISTARNFYESAAEGCLEYMNDIEILDGCRKGRDKTSIPSHGRCEKQVKDILLGIHSCEATTIKDFTKYKGNKCSIDALNNLGRIYQDPRGGFRDLSTALLWYARGAELCDPASMTSIGLLFEQDEDNIPGIRRDEEKARNWYKSGENDPAANYHLARLYEKRLTTKSIKLKSECVKVLDLYRKAARAGFHDAQKRLLHGGKCR